MKINISDLVDKHHKTDRDENIKWFIISLITHHPDKDCVPGAINGPSIADIEIKVNGQEMDYFALVNRHFDQFERMVNESAAEKIDEIITELKSNWNNTIAQFMHKNGLIDNDTYREKVLGY